MKRIQKYQTNEKPYDGGTLPEIEVNAKLPTIGAYRQYVKSRNPDFQVSDDGQVIPTSGAIWRDFLNPSYTPDNFGIEEYSDYKTNYEASDDGDPNTRYMPTNLQYAGAGFPGISTLMKIPRLIKMRKRLGLLKKIQQTSKTSMTFSDHVNNASKVKDVVSKTSKVKEVVSNTGSKVIDKFNSIPTSSKIGAGTVVGGKIIYDAIKEQTGGFQKFQQDGWTDQDYINNGMTPPTEGGTTTGNTDPNAVGNWNPGTGSYNQPEADIMFKAGNRSGVGIDWGGSKGGLKKLANWGKGVWNKSSGLGKAGIVASGVGLPIAGIAAGLDPTSWLSQAGGFDENYQVAGMQNAYAVPESIQPQQQMQQQMQSQQQQMPYPQQQEPQMYQMKGSDQGTSLLDRIESTTRVKGGRLVPIGNGVAIEGNQHDVSKNDAIDGFTEGVEFAPGKAAEGGEVMANAQVAGNTGEYMFSEAMKLNGEFGYKKGLGPSIADGAKEILSADLPKQIEQEKLNRLASMQETNKPDTNEDGMAKNYEYSKYGGFPNNKYQAFGWNNGTITPYTGEGSKRGEIPTLQTILNANPGGIGNTQKEKSIMGDGYESTIDNTTRQSYTTNPVSTEVWNTLSKDEQMYVALHSKNTASAPSNSEPSKVVKEKKKLPNLNVASGDKWEYGDIPARQGSANTKGGLNFFNSDKDLDAWVKSDTFESDWLSNIDQGIKESIGISSINDMNDGAKVLAYQKAWNLKYPDNKIQEDGKFGEQTIRTARLGSSEEEVIDDGSTEETTSETTSETTLDKLENNKKSRWSQGVNKMGQYLSKNGLDLIAGGIQLAGPIAAYKKPIRMATAVTAPGYRGSRVNYDSLIKEATDQGNARKQTARNNITGPGLEQALAKIDAETQGNIMKIKNGESNQNLSLQDSEAKINTQINQGNATAMNRIEELNTKNLIQHDVDKVEAIDRATNRIANVIGNYQDRKTREFSAEIISGETGVYTRMDFQKQTGMTAASNPEAYIQWLELNNPAMLKRLKADKLTDTKTEETEENN